MAALPVKVALSPGGGQLGLVYSAALGSFTGPHWSVVVSAGPSGAADVRVLEPRVRYLQWHPDGQAVFGYGRNPEGDGSGIFRAVIEP